VGLSRRIEAFGWGFVVAFSLPADPPFARLLLIGPERTEDVPDK